MLIDSAMVVLMTTPCTEIHLLDALSAAFADEPGWTEEARESHSE